MKFNEVVEKKKNDAAYIVLNCFNGLEKKMGTIFDDMDDCKYVIG